VKNEGAKQGRHPYLHVCVGKKKRTTFEEQKNRRNEEKKKRRKEERKTGRKKEKRKGTQEVKNEGAKQGRHPYLHVRVGKKKDNF
jgi:hypothetical protein